MVRVRVRVCVCSVCGTGHSIGIFLLFQQYNSNIMRVEGASVVKRAVYIHSAESTTVADLLFLGGERRLLAVVGVAV